MLSRLIRSYESEDGVIVSQTEQTYDSKGRDESYSYDGDGLSYGYEYGYNDKDRLGTTRQYYNGRNENSDVIAYGYFGRVRFRIYAGDYNGRISYSYQSYADDANRLTSNMTSMRYTFNGILTFADYTYDNIGNIKSSKYTYDDKVYSEVAYVYDDHNRLIAENCTNSNIGITPYMSSYSYDSFGNITETERPNSAGVTVKNTYSYENSSWRDLLTAYNGHTITYDKIGNPLLYYNGRSYTMNWEMGRQMYTSRVNSRTVYYDYNKDGIRIKKNVSGRYTDRYILDGSKVIGMERTKSGSSVKDVYHFIYDEMGNIWEAVCYIGGSTTPVRYFYRTNAQGDVKQIVDSNYNVVAYYAYDAWGKLLAVLDGNDNPITDSSHFAIVNPFRYRSYVYDTETGFYYLQSRYYDPEIGRFVNADGQLNQQESISGYNLFAYCGNNPVKNSDPDGHSFILACIITCAVIGALAGGHFAAKASKAKTGRVSKKAVVGGIVGGAAAGALIGWGIGAAVTAIGSAISAALPVVGEAVQKASEAANSTTASEAVETGKNIYYQVTSKASFEQIKATFQLTPLESPYVYVMQYQPTLQQAKNLGCRSIETVIRFSTNFGSFVNDDTCAITGALVSNIPGTISIMQDVTEVGFK